MAQRCVLTIYEPEKDPRVVEMQINPPNSGGDDRSVYNEDGTVLNDYQLYVQTADNRLIKAPPSNDKSTKKWDTLKFWKRWKPEMNCVGETSSMISDVPVSENTRNYLKTYKINSTKKEKKIARIKNVKIDDAEKKRKRILKKQRKREKKKLLMSQILLNKDRVLPKLVLIRSSASADTKSDVGKPKWKLLNPLDSKNENRSLPTKFVPTVSNAKADTKSEAEKSNRKLPCLLDIQIRDYALPTQIEPTESDACVNRESDLGDPEWKQRRPNRLDADLDHPPPPRKRRRKMTGKMYRLKKKEQKRMMAALKTGTDNSNSLLSKRIDSSSNCAPNVKENRPKIHIRWNADEPATDFSPISASNQPSEKSNSEIRPIRWKADEPAVDFIPIGASNQSSNKSNNETKHARWSANEPAVDFIPIGASNQSSNKSNNETKHVRWRANEPAVDFIPIGASNQSSNKSNTESRYQKFKDSIHPQPSDFIGLSQKAFFLQC